MPKISKGGVSDVRVDETYVAPPGTSPQEAIDLGLPDAGQPQERKSDERDDEHGESAGAGNGTDGQLRGKRDVPAKRTGAGKRTSR